MSDFQYVTTAIVYPNSRIHVGWAWECLGADWLVRSRQAFGEPTFFCTGMDEHSLNVQKAAENEGLEPKAYCDRMSDDIQKVLQQMGLSFDRFIRTSDEDHEWVVQQLVQRAFDSGDIYKDKYEGHYCESCEAYYTEKELVDGNCPHHGKKPTWLSEENFFFRLSKYQDRLLELFEKNPGFLEPESRRNEILNVIKGGLIDFSISRSNFTWGVQLPWEKSHVIYVWFDALINYLTAAGIEHKLKDPEGEKAKEFDRVWSGATHIIGKDITRFHCIYWPAMLMSLDLPLPKRVFAHGWLTFKGQRMSKSSGNRVTPDEVMEVSGSDPFRYFLLADNSFSGEGMFSWEALIDKANADLSNDWGNLVNRTISMTRKYFPDQPLKSSENPTHSDGVIESFGSLKESLLQTMEEIDPQSYANACRERSRVLNLFIDKMKPWKLAKSEEESDREALKETLFTVLEGIRWIATAFQPILPDGMPKVFGQLGLDVPDWNGALQRLEWGQFEFTPNKPEPIYPRLEMPSED